MDFVERITRDGETLCLIVRDPGQLEATTFVTPPEFNMQVGFVVYPKGAEIPRHAHLPVERNVTSTSEVILVYRGSCAVDIYDDDRELVASRELATGDVVVLMSGGHGFRLLEDTILMEVKQGPYSGLEEKVRF